MRHVYYQQGFNLQNLYENMLRLLFHHLKCIFCHQNMIKILCRDHLYQFFFLFFILLNKTFSYSPNSIDISTPFAVLTYSPFSETIQYIFDFNPINLLIGISLNSSFILLITFLLVKWKNFDLYSLKSNVYI